MEGDLQEQIAIFQTLRTILPQWKTQIWWFSFEYTQLNVCLSIIVAGED